jgi:two-component system response regulator HydG
MSIRVAVPDDAALRRTVESLPDVTVEALAPREAAGRAKRGEVDVLFLDADAGDAFAMLEECKKARPELEVVLVSATAKMETAVKAMRMGAGDYLARPVKADQAALAVDRARRMRRLLEENRRLREQLRDRGAAREIVGMTAGMERLRQQAERAREGGGGVLIVGEPGTEREAVARAMHRDGPFIKVDVEALGPGAVTEELVGRGAALSRAAGGTLFVDEVGLVPIDAQEALARPAGARVIAATGRNLLESVGRGLFRGDLLGALAGTTLAIPPLRERIDDLPLLVDAILRRRAAEGRKAAKAPTSEAMDTLRAHAWPGNVKELEQAVERACELGGGEWMERQNLPPSVIQGAEAARKTGSAEITRSLKEMESQVIHTLLSEHRGDTEAVARILKIDRSTLYRKIKRYGIDLGEMK